ncbi:MAG: sulfate adenylyltransferase subunit 1, partial [Crocinitomicaceae bacterium]
MDLLRFFTAGNVDDGKSTLIGRLLLDSHSISTDIIEILTKQSKNTNSNTPIDLALLTDGLRAEREQGITIDVAYKYFSSTKRKYIIADTPGHAEYTRNMFTGASTCDLALILIDARLGVTEQTKRHTIIASILGIPNLVICINKMDLVEYNEIIFNQIKQDYLAFSASLNLTSVDFVPLSALLGENVVKRSEKMNWFEGQTLFEFLENIKLDYATTQNPSRFQVQYIIRPQTEELHGYRGYAGTVLSGKFSIEDEVFIYPSDQKSRIKRIEKNQQEVSNVVEGDP